MGKNFLRIIFLGCEGDTAQAWPIHAYEAIDPTCTIETLFYRPCQLPGHVVLRRDGAPARRVGPSKCHKNPKPVRFVSCCGPRPPFQRQPRYSKLQMRLARSSDAIRQRSCSPLSNHARG